MGVNTTEDTVKNRLSLMGAVLVMSIAVACSNDEPVEQASQLDAALTTIVSSEGTPPPVQVVKVPVPTSGEATSAGGAVSTVGPGLSVAEAIASTLEGPLLVNGFIFTKASDVWLCSSLPREQDPTCGEPSIAVAGLDPTTIDGVQLLEGVGWTNETTQVLGVMIDGVLTVSGTMLAQ